MSFLRWLHGLSLQVILEESSFYSSQEEPLGVVWAFSYNSFWIKRGQASWICPTGRRPSGRSRSRWRDYFSWWALASLCVVPQELEDEAMEIQAWVSWFTLLLPWPSIDKNVIIIRCGTNHTPPLADNAVWEENDLLVKGLQWEMHQDKCV